MEKIKNENTLQIINVSLQKDQPKSCPACNNGDIPSGAHTCNICKVVVHALDNCSLTYDEEGYGQKRICIPCSLLEGSQNILATRETENWRGLNKNRKRKARYLDDPCGIQDALTWRSAKLPIMRNGSSTELQAVKIEDQNYCFINTCAFDSVLQIVLAALSDYKDFETEVYYFKNLFKVKSYVLSGSSYKVTDVKVFKIYIYNYSKHTEYFSSHKFNVTAA